MDQPYEFQYETAIFEDVQDFNDDLTRSSRRANLLAWTLAQMAAGSFSLEQNNEWFVDLSCLFLEIVRSDLSKAATLSEEIWREQNTERRSEAARAAEFEAVQKEADELEKMRDAALGATVLATSRARIIGETLKQVLVGTGLAANSAEHLVKEIVDEAWKGRSVDVSEAVLRLQDDEEEADQSSRHFTESAHARRDVAEVLS